MFRIFSEEPDSTPRILVVEDDAAQCTALTRVLNLEGYAVDTACDAATALKHVDGPIDMVISDLRMGRLSGIDLMRAWYERRCDTPFILVTGYDDPRAMIEAQRLGVLDFITKPIDPQRLLKVVKHCLAPQSAARPQVPETPQPLRKAA